MTRLPPTAVEWLEARGVRSSSVTVTRGGRAVVFLIGDLVLRWYGSGTRGPDEPDAIAREAAALTAVAGSSVPAPRLVAWTEEPPALLMTRLPGEHRLDSSGASAVRALLESIHAIPSAAVARWRYRGYHEGLAMRRPGWWRDALLWERALASSAARPALIADPVLIHRDFHPGNLLWIGHTVSGVVDWSDACIGPAAFDLAHFRVNIASLEGPDAADEALPGDPAWDVDASLGYLDPQALDAWVGPWPHVPVPVARERLEAFIARAVAALG